MTLWHQRFRSVWVAPGPSGTQGTGGWGGFVGVLSQVTLDSLDCSSPASSLLTRRSWTSVVLSLTPLHCHSGPCRAVSPLDKIPVVTAATTCCLGETQTNRRMLPCSPKPLRSLRLQLPGVGVGVCERRLGVPPKIFPLPST